MAYASTAAAGPSIRIPRWRPPAFRRPHVSKRTRALLMMGVMISPCFLADSIGYCVQRMFYTADQIADRQAPEAILAKIDRFDVACPAAEMPVAERGLWAGYAAQQGWESYLPAGAGCFKPGRNLRGAIGLKVFMVACPRTLLSALEQRRWVAYASDHRWDAYPQAGAGCVDP